MSSIFETAPAAARWPTYSHVIFDCDSTLSTIEGIDELSQQPDTREQIVELTTAAMEGRLPLDAVYGERLSLIAPTREAVRGLAAVYRQHLVADAELVVNCLMQHGCAVYIVSGGLLEPVREFGISLGIPAENIRAVELAYDQLSDGWWNGDQGSAGDSSRYITYQQSALAISSGKSDIINQLIADGSGASLLVGDGVSDLMARNAVDLFIGFGGVVSRQEVRHKAPAFFDCPTLLPVLPLALGDPGFYKLEPSVRDAALTCVQQSPPRFNRAVLSSHFSRSFLAIPSSDSP